MNLLKFDPTNATDEQIQAWLFAVVNAELEKPESQMDYNLITECLICESFLYCNESPISNEKLRSGLTRIKEMSSTQKQDIYRA